MAEKKEGKFFGYGSGKAYIDSILSGERLSNNLKTVAGMIAGRKIKNMSQQNKDITSAQAKRAVKDSIAEAKAKQKPASKPSTAADRRGSNATLKPKTKTTTKSKPTKSTSPAGPPRTIAQAKKRGLDYFVGKDGKPKAAVTAEDLKKSGHKTLRAYLNAKGKPAKKKDKK